jgi:hypothetical protein
MRWHDVTADEEGRRGPSDLHLTSLVCWLLPLTATTLAIGIVTIVKTRGGRKAERQQPSLHSNLTFFTTASSAIDNATIPARRGHIAAEIQHHIAVELGLDNDANALYNLSLTSKSLRDVAQPALLNVFSIQRTEDRDQQEGVSRSIFEKSPYFKCHTSQPEYAKAVKTIDIRFDGWRNVETSDMQLHDQVLFGKVFLEFVPPTASKRHSKEEWNLFALLDLLLSRLQIFRNLYFVPQMSRGNVWPEHTSAAKKKPVRRFFQH